MEIKYTLTQEDYIRFNMDQAKISSSIKKSILIQRIMGPILFMITSVVIARFSDAPIWYWYTLFGLGSIIWYIFYPKYIDWEMKNRLKKVLKEKNNDNLFNESTLRIEQNGLRSINEMGDNIISWNKIVDIIENEEYFYVYITSVSAFIIPKRVFETQEEESKFINLIDEYMDKKEFQ